MAMENFPSDSDMENLVRELAEGKELAKQLQNHLNLQSSSSSSSSSYESREYLLQRIMRSYDQALSMLVRNQPAAAGETTTPPPLQPTSESPQSDDSDQDFTDRKRKQGSGKWSEKVKVRAEVGIEGQLDDGYGWRKYGQKDILGAKHPRGYYRCTHRHAHGCLATKQVQRSDEDPTIFEITYRRKHTCNREHAIQNPPAPIPDPHNAEDPNPSTHNQQNEPPFNIQTCLTNNNTNPFNNIFSDLNGGDYYPNPIQDLNDNYGELIPNLRHADSELSPIVAGITSTSNKSATNLHTDYPFGSFGYGSGFGFGDSGHFP